MVNLLFISNSTKIDTIKPALQPFLKVKIDVVADFDYGLKDVFEKRPATVFIQDQIAGVTGESVARHIQMLLGGGAPAFIYMHDGNPKVKPIKGLFEYLIDLSQSDSKVVTDIQATLKSLLGPQWDKIYIAPKIDKVAVRDAIAGPEASRASADRLVDDFLSDLDTFGAGSAGTINPLTDFSETGNPEVNSFQVVSSPQDQLTEMFSESSRESHNTQLTPIAADGDVTDILSVPAPQRVPALHKGQSPATPLRSESSTVEIAPVSVAAKPAPKDGAPVPVKPARPAGSSVTIPPENQPIQQASPADFIISAETPDEPVAPEELLRVFEGNYYSQPGGWKRYAAIVLFLTVLTGVGSWYLLKQKSFSLPDFFKSSTKADVVVSAAKPPEPAPPDQKPTPTPVRKPEAPALPTFIPQERLDSSFASQKPGWERYVDATVEFRVFRPEGKIKALQVLGVKNHAISEPKLKSILIELMGDGDYRVTSREQKLGYDVSRATVGQKADLLIYRKKAAVRAFVVSLN